MSDERLRADIENILWRYETALAAVRVGRDIPRETWLADFEKLRTIATDQLLAWVTPLSEEIARLKRGDFTEHEFQNLCHNFSEDDAGRFREGCRAYQEKLFSKEPT